MSMEVAVLGFKLLRFFKWLNVKQCDQWQTYDGGSLNTPCNAEKSHYSCE